MVKKTFFALLIGVMAVSLVPSVGMGRYSHGAYYSHHYGHHHHHHGDALLFGLGGLVLGTTIAAAALQPPPRPVVYAPPVYTYQPAVPPGMCRWERYVLDGYGRTLYDHYGQPVKEYTVGPCQYAPY